MNRDKIQEKLHELYSQHAGLSVRKFPPGDGYHLLLEQLTIDDIPALMDLFNLDSDAVMFLLKKLVGKTPYTKEDWGDFHVMKNAWYDYLRRRGLIKVKDKYNIKRYAWKKNG